MLHEAFRGVEEFLQKLMRHRHLALAERACSNLTEVRVELATAGFPQLMVRREPEVPDEP